MYLYSRFFLSLDKLFFTVLFIGQTNASFSSEFAVSEIASGIHVHTGTNVGLENPRREDIANIGFIVGTRCVAVVDTGGSVVIGKKLKRAVRQVTRLPVCYVINTHVHFDHVLGNFAFKDENPKFVGHHRLVWAIESNRKYFAETFAKELRLEGTNCEIVAPDTLVKETMILDLGNRELLLSAYDAAHSSHDLSVVDTKTNTLWLGDLLFSGHVPTLDGSLLGWINVVNKLRMMNFDRVVPGHGPIVLSWPEAAADQLRYFRVLAQDIRRIIGSGGFLEDALVTAGRSEQNKWELFEKYHRRNVTRAFAELEWE